VNFQPINKEFAAIYARKSTKMESYSLETQASLARKLIEEKGLFVYDVYEDEESATKFHPMHRTGFKRLLYDAMQGKFKTVVVFRRDRLARKIEDLLEIKNFFKKYGIKIIYSNQGEFQTDEDSYISNFIENIIMSIDELEPGILRERITAGKEQARLRGGYSGKAPFGYIKYLDEEEKKKIKPDVDAAIVKDIFSRFLKDVDSLDNFDLFISKVTKDYKGKKFNKKKIIDILLRPLYGGLITVNANQDIYQTLIKDESGMYRVNSDLYRNCTDLADSIISSSEWFACIEKLSMLMPQLDTIEEEEGNYLFKSFVKCGTCGETIYLSNKKYKCIKGCTNVDLDKFENTLLEKIVGDIVTNKYIKSYQEKSILELELNIKKTTEQTQILKDKQDIELKKLIYNYNQDPKTDYSYINKLITEEQAEREKINIRKQEATQKNIAIEKLKEILKLRNRDVIIIALKRRTEIAQQLLKEIIDTITVKTVEVNTSAELKFDINFTRE
jgi:site-specific DNA recombinase